MIDHTGVIVSDLAKSKVFFSAALGAMEISLLKELPASVTGHAGVVGYGAKETITQGVSPEFWLSQGRPGNVPVHVAFRVDNRALVDAFYQAALTAGGRDNGAPRLRPQYHSNYYGAFVRDPDGNNIEAVCRTPA